jgi:hypothetical protein
MKPKKRGRPKRAHDVGRAVFEEVSQGGKIYQVPIWIPRKSRRKREEEELAEVGKDVKGALMHLLEQQRPKDPKPERLKKIRRSLEIQRDRDVQDGKSLWPALKEKQIDRLLDNFEANEKLNRKRSRKRRRP